MDYIEQLPQIRLSQEEQRYAARYSTDSQRTVKIPISTTQRSFLEESSLSLSRLSLHGKALNSLTSAWGLKLWSFLERKDQLHKKRTKWITAQEFTFKIPLNKIDQLLASFALKYIKKLSSTTANYALTDQKAPWLSLWMSYISNPWKTKIEL